MAGAEDKLAYEVGEFIQVVIFGHVWVTAGASVSYGMLLHYQHNDGRWDGVSQPTSVATLHHYPVTCASRDDGADGSLIEARIGYGRVG